MADRHSDEVEVSPPTRGWTAKKKAKQAGKAGFPAHAGMDPYSAASSAVAAGFPRPRGDGPITYRFSGWRVRVSPPTRGWTSAT